MRQRFCKVCEGWHALDEPWPVECYQPLKVARSSLAFPMVVSDSMPATEHVDGKFYTSKRAYREVTRSRGYIEVGNEKIKPPSRPEPDKAGIRESLKRAMARVS